MQTGTMTPTPFWWRAAIAAGVVVLAGVAYLGAPLLGPRFQAGLGILCFIGITFVFSANIRAVNWRTVGWGVALQVLLALFILKLEIGGVRPGYQLFSFIGGIIKKFLEFTDEGSRFVFGRLAETGPTYNQPELVGGALGPSYRVAAMQDAATPRMGFVFAFKALPTIIFVSSFFTVLYYYGVLQFIVRLMARGMMFLMKTSGAETLSAAANVFMGQTEAPLIVKPYVPKMTQSELLAMMVGGMATISGGVMAVYIGMGADPVAILATSVMAAPCGLYLSKILLPEMETPQTSGKAEVVVEQAHRNAIDAAAAGASDGLHLALNVAAMLIAFLAFIALLDYVLNAIHPTLALQNIFGWVFSPLAFLMGIETNDIPRVADLLGIKLVGNEFVAYTKLTTKYQHAISARSYTLSTYALTGFANFSSIGIQIGGIGAMAPARRPDLARLGTRALLAGFLATLVNAALAGFLLE